MTMLFITLFGFLAAFVSSQSTVDFVPPTQDPPKANINPFDTGGSPLPVCGESQLLNFISGSFVCVTDYETQTERSIAEGADPSEQNQLVDEDGELIEDYRFLCLSTQYFNYLGNRHL